MTQNAAQYYLHHVTYSPAKFEVALPSGLKVAFIRNTLHDLDLGVKFTQNVALYPTHHVIYAPAKCFKVAKVKVTQNVAYYPLHHAT